MIENIELKKGSRLLGIQSLLYKIIYIIGMGNFAFSKIVIDRFLHRTANLFGFYQGRIQDLS